MGAEELRRVTWVPHEDQPCAEDARVVLQPVEHLNLEDAPISDKMLVRVSCITHYTSITFKHRGKATSNLFSSFHVVRRVPTRRHVAGAMHTAPESQRNSDLSRVS
jgi:hypothetical protein